MFALVQFFLPMASYNSYYYWCYSCVDSSSTPTDTLSLPGWPPIACLLYPSLRYHSASFWPTKTCSVKTDLSLVQYVSCYCHEASVVQASKTQNIIYVVITKLNQNTSNYSIEDTARRSLKLQHPPMQRCLVDLSILNLF